MDRYQHFKIIPPSILTENKGKWEGGDKGSKGEGDERRIIKGVRTEKMKKD